jgi:hypothetical protein
MLKPKWRAELPTNGYKGETAGYANWLLPWMPDCPAMGSEIKLLSSAVLKERAKRPNVANRGAVYGVPSCFALLDLLSGVPGMTKLMVI